jgi:Regulator of chromosome condensation (RCC1) repeat
MNKGGVQSMKQREMVFSWGCNRNHQLALAPLELEQVEQVNEPELVECLLEYQFIRKIKCQGNKTMVLVDEPNTLLVFCKAERVVEELRQRRQRRAFQVRSLVNSECHIRISDP